MRCSSVLVATVAAFATASGQYHSKAFLQRRTDGNAWSSSFTKTVSWFQGKDGQIHKQTQETRNKVVQDGSGMTQTHSKVVCKDGRCQEVVEMAQRPAMQEGGSMPMYNRPMSHIPPRMQQMLDRIWGPMQRPQEQRPMVGLRQPEIIIQGQRPGEIIIQPARSVPFQSPFQSNEQRKPFLGRSDDNNVMREIALQRQQQLDAEHWRAVKYISLGAACCALGTLYITVLLILKCKFGRSSAREVSSIRTLGEPLVEDAADSVMQLGAAQEPKVTEALHSRVYLSRLYARANARSESALVRKYMASLYSRILG